MKLLNLALAGLVAFAAASPVETTAIAAWKYKNDDLHMYKCNGRGAIDSCVAGEACLPVEKCSTRCFEDDEGAGCVDSSTAAAAVESSEKRDVEPEVNADDKKTYECSNDHTGVLVCQFGFCQTDHYCKRGTKCRDKCSCCKKMADLERGIDDLEITAISQPESDNDVQALTIESNTLASRANEERRDGPCRPGTYTCFLSPSTGSAWVMVCAWNGRWQYSSDCGDMKCLEDAPGVAHCWNPGQEWDSNPNSVSPRNTPDQVPSDLTPSLDCRPGEFACAWDNSTRTEWTIVCDQSGHNWRWSSNCGQGMKCVSSGGVAHCVAAQALFEAWKKVQSLAIAASTMATVVIGASASAKA